MPLNQSEAARLIDQLTQLVSGFVEADAARGGEGQLADPSLLAGYEVVAVEVLPAGFDYRWPKRDVPTRYRPGPVPTARYRLRTEAGEYSLLIGQEEGGRATHGVRGRGRIVVFVGRDKGKSLYPLVEFAEADVRATGGAELYVAGIPRPRAPRSLALASDLDDLRRSAPHLMTADIRRADEVYTMMASGPTLRLVVSVGDVEAMLVHGLWVGQQRGGGRLPRPAPRT